MQTSKSVGFDDVFEVLQNGKSAELAAIAKRNPTFPSGCDPYGQAWLFHAIDIGHPASLTWMLWRGVTLANDKRGRSPLQAAIERTIAVDEFDDSPVDALPMIADLVAHGAELNATNAQGLRPLHLAASTGAVRAFSELLRLGADPILPDSMGATAWDYATRYEHFSVLDMPDSANGGVT